MTWLAQGAPEKAPTSPWGGIGDAVTGLAGTWTSWAMYLGVFIAICSAIILFAMMAIDRNRGEAGIASSDQARWLKWGIGLGLVATAPQVMAWFISATPW